LQNHFHIKERKLVFYARSIQSTEINAQSDLTSYFPNGEQIGNPLRILNRKTYPIFEEFFQILPNSSFKCRINESFFFLTGFIPSFIGMACCIIVGSKNNEDPHITKRKNIEIHEVAQ
jgi:hypothetical protein